MAVNKNPISLREGKIFLDGIQIMDGVKCDIYATPDVWTGRSLSERTPSSRWLGIAYKGNITRRRSTPEFANKVKDYSATGITPELTIQGISDDPNSDYYQANGGPTVVTATGCVLTGDIPLLNLDSGGDIADDSISFAAKDVV